MEADGKLQALLEAVLFASPQPVSWRDLLRMLDQPEEKVCEALERLRAEQGRPERGLHLRETRGGFQLVTKPELQEALREALRSGRARAPLSLPALETLAIIAYKQPISAPEVQKIRGVEGAGVLETLLKRRLIARTGHHPEGRAQLYRTTSQLLANFGLRDLQELPALPEFKELRELYERADRGGSK